MELKEITEGVYYIPNPANIGVVKDRDNSVILIDTGLDGDAGRRILKLLEENNYSVKAIVNTHSHADHCGGNKYIKEKTGAEIYAPEVESAIIEYPSLEPLYFFSGASPLKDLKNKFLMAQSSPVDHVIRDALISFENRQLSVIPLPGHSSNQIGLEVENILFCADSVFSGELLKRHKIPFYTDIDKERETLKLLSESKYRFYVPSHAEPQESIIDLVNANLEVIDGVEGYLLDNFNGGKTTEQIIKDLCDHYQIDMKSVQQYYLMNTVTMAYLSSLYNRQKLTLSIKDNTLFWKRI